MKRIDVCGLKCPLPVLKLEKYIAKIDGEFILELIVDDEMAIIDVPLYCKQNNYTCQISKQQGVFTFIISNITD